MAGRNMLPLEILEKEKKSHHITKEEKKRRVDGAVNLPDGDIVCPDYVKKNIEAFKKWNDVTPYLIEAKLIKPSDVGCLARLCITHSEYMDLLYLREYVRDIEDFDMSEEIEIKNAMEKEYSKKKVDQMWKKVEFIFSAQGVLPFDKAINQKLQILLTYEDKFFLTMLSRIKNIIPEKHGDDETAEKKLENEMFG